MSQIKGTFSLGRWRWHTGRGGTFPGISWVREALGHLGRGSHTSASSAVGVQGCVGLSTHPGGARGTLRSFRFSC